MKKLPDAELAVMQALWQAGGEATSGEIQAMLRKRYDWKPTSVLTFLSRLTEKGFVDCRKEGKVNHYTACISEQAYRQRASVDFMQRLFDGSVKNLMVSLAEAGSMTAKDLEELQAFLDEQKGGA